MANGVEGIEAPLGSGDIGGVYAKEQAILAKQEAARISHDKIIDGKYQFPAKLGQGEGDLLNWMKFQAYEISGGFSGSKMVQFSNTGKGFAALPIPAGINASYDQSWNQAEVGQFKQLVGRGLQGAGIGGIAGWLRGEGAEGLDMGNLAGRFKGAFGNMSWTQEASASILQSTPGLAETTQFSTQMRALDQVMMSYGGPAFRSFNFSFALKPLNLDDSIVIDNMVRFFKVASAPFQLQTQMTRLYDLPDVFKISFHNGNYENKYLPKIGHCALTNVGVSYGGDKFTTFDMTSGMPVQVDLTLQFKEMELLDRNHFIDRWRDSAEDGGGENIREGEVDANSGG